MKRSIDWPEGAQPLAFSRVFSLLRRNEGERSPPMPFHIGANGHQAWRRCRIHCVSAALQDGGAACDAREIRGDDSGLRNHHRAGLAAVLRECFFFVMPDTKCAATAAPYCGMFAMDPSNSNSCGLRRVVHNVASEPLYVVSP